MTHRIESAPLKYPSSLDNEYDGSKVLIVAGMHRSGTSLTANWLAQCGLDVGDDLISGLPDNPRGHFEDRTFVYLHIDILKDNGTDHLVVPGQQLTLHAEHYDRAREIVHAQPRERQWGWKDPRTTLFLPFWKTIVPRLKVLAVYRPNREVVRSLLHRDRMRWLRTHPSRANFALRPASALPFSEANAPRVRRYLRVWDRYNRDLLAFADEYPADVVVVRIDDVMKHSELLIDYINHSWGFSLNPVNSESIVVPDLIHHLPENGMNRYMTLLCPSVSDTWNHLEELRSRTMSEISTQAGAMTHDVRA